MGVFGFKLRSPVSAIPEAKLNCATNVLLGLRAREGEVIDG